MYSYLLRIRLVIPETSDFALAFEVCVVHYVMPACRITSSKCITTSKHNYLIKSKEQIRAYRWYGIEVKYLHACGMSWKLKQWGQKPFSCAISLLAWHCTSLISNYLMQRACYWFVLAVRAQVQSGDGTGSLPVVFAWLDFCFWYGCQDRAVLYRNIIEAIASLKQYSCRNKLALGHFKVVYLSWTGGMVSPFHCYASL